jgi:hypothetical protein
MRVKSKLLEQNSERCGGLTRSLNAEHGGRVWSCLQNEGRVKAFRTRLFRIAFIRTGTHRMRVRPKPFERDRERCGGLKRSLKG